MAFTEFCCRSGGSNLNAGTKSGNSTEPGTSADYTCTNSNWDGTSVFTPTDGSTPASTVNVGDFASVYLDAATVAVYIGRVTAVAAGVNGAITISTTAKSGTAPSNGATGRSIKVGGAWKGPNAAEAFPFGFITNALTNSGGDNPRVNFKNAASFSITAAMTQSNAGPMTFQGYTTSYGDLGRATIDGGTSGAAYVLLNLNANDLVIRDMIFQNNGATGADYCLQLGSGARLQCDRVVVNSCRSGGFGCNGASPVILSECEAYSCNASGTGNMGGFRIAATGIVLDRCISHDNTGEGFYFDSNSFIINSIADSNSNTGVTFATSLSSAINCELYNNTSDGIKVSAGVGSTVYIENCNFIKNGGWGVNLTGGGIFDGTLYNNGFGAGTQANASGTTTGLGSNVVEVGSITYASNVTPWVDPANGDFRINLSTAINAGRGKFTQTAPSYAGTVGYPDIGAAQHLESGSNTIAFPVHVMNSIRSAPGTVGY